MKKIKIFSLSFIILFCSLIVACSSNACQTLAKDLDTSVKNLIIAVSSLDWPEDGTLDSLNTIQENATTSNSVVTDTKIDTSEIYTWLENAHSKINILLSKRGDLLLYLNEIYGGNTALEETDLQSIKVYLNIIKDNSNYLNSYNGMLKNQMNQASSLFESNENVNLINAYIIKAVETLQVRCAKIDTSVLAISSIIDIIKSNLINDYYNYNEHKIEKLNEENTNQQPKEDTSNIMEESNKTIPDPNQKTLEDNTEQDNSQNTDEQKNAINFDGEVQQVENPSSAQPTTHGTQPATPPADDNSKDIVFKQSDNLENQNDLEKQSSEIIKLKDEENINYDDQVQTLEEPIVENNDDKEPLNNNLPKMQKNIKKEVKNTISQYNINDLENIDKEFTYQDDENEENSPVTREIIKDNAI